MNSKPLAAVSPLLLLALCGAAHAELEPFSFGATETLSHENNVNHGPEGNRIPSWRTVTELRAGVDQPVGRDQFKASVSANYNTYSNLHDRNSFGYLAGTEFDWSTAGDLSGSLGASSRRRQYLFGLEGETLSTTARNLETNNRAFGNVELGGLARWTLFAGFDAQNRNYSADSFRDNDERQWSTNVGTRYSTSPDLSFGVVGNFTHGEYPNYVNDQDVATAAGFSTKSVSFTTRLKATGNSAFDAAIGYTHQTSDLQPELKFVSGSLNWVWTPPSRFDVHLSLARSSNGGAVAADVASLNERSVNDTASLTVNYELTGKVSLVAQAAYIKRKYDNVLLPVTFPGTDLVAFETIDGINHSQRFGLFAHYKPTRTTDVNCGASYESLSAKKPVNAITPAYKDVIYSCTGGIDFN